MNNMKKKGFTVVELVIVIAIVAVLAAVLIPTFANLIKKANDSAYLQERTNQQIADLAEKVATQNEHYLTWEDFEAKLAEKFAEINKSQLNDDDLKTAISNALAEYDKAHGSQNTALTEEQVKADKHIAFEENFYTAPASISGLPAVAAGGVQLVGAAFSDKGLLEIAEILEKGGKL